MWRLSQVSLLNEKPIYLGSPIKIVIDLNSTSFQPLLQSTVTMPIHPTPPEDLATLLESPNEQRVDVLALLASVGEPRTATTKWGQRTIVHIMIRDLSGPAGASECELPIFLPKITDWRRRVGSVASCLSRRLACCVLQSGRIIGSWKRESYTQTCMARFQVEAL